MYRFESWTIRKAECQRIVMLEKTIESPLDSKEIKPSILKEINPKCSLEGLMLKLTSNTLATWCEKPTQWKRPWCCERGQEEKGLTEDKMVGWHHQLNVNEFEQAPGDSEGQGSLACCSPWGHKELDATERLNNKQQQKFFNMNRYFRKENINVRPMKWWSVSLNIMKLSVKTTMRHGHIPQNGRCEADGWAGVIGAAASLQTLPVGV